MIVRLATPDDAAAIAAVQVRTWWTTYGDHVEHRVLDGAAAGREEHWRTTLAGEIRTAVAEQDGQIVGFAAWGASRDPDGDGAGELYAIYVAPEVQGAGVGTRLQDAVLDALRADDHPSATLWVMSANAQARSFYEKSGWSAEPETETTGGWGVRKVRYRRAL